MTFLENFVFSLNARIPHLLPELRLVGSSLVCEHLKKKSLDESVITRDSSNPSNRDYENVLSFGEKLHFAGEDAPRLSGPLVFFRTADIS